MKKIYLALSLVVVIAVGIGCSHDDPAAPESASPIGGDLAKANPHGLRPDGYYSMFFTEETGSYSEFSLIDPHDGEADFVWRLQFPLGGDGENSFGWTPFGFAFDVDGTMYMTQNIIAFDPAEVRSQFARVDSETGEVFSYDPIVDFNTSGGDIDACGNFYVCGFQVDALGYIWGNDSLWQVDKMTGEFTEIGPTGHTNWMDLAFDRDGTLWGTFDNELYVIDTETGASSFVTEIHGVPDAGEPHFMEVMSIAFDKHDQLLGTGLTVYFDHPEGSPVMSIDVTTGEATLLGYSQTVLANHGGDIMPNRVKIAHRESDGSYSCQWIGMRALEAHLAHGDYVPGSAGHDCDCP